MDRDEIVVVGTLPDVDLGADASPEAAAAAPIRQIKQFREDTRDARIRIAREAEHRFRRKVAWGAQCGDVRELFTTLSIPVMTRLPGCASAKCSTRWSRRAWPAAGATPWHGAFGWSVRTSPSGSTDFRDAMQGVAKVRAEGPGAGSA